jgi:GNAT superfamily N-acetyltransferase
MVYVDGCHGPQYRGRTVTRAVTLRRATADDAVALARGVVEGVADYPAFAPAGWSGPTYEDELAHHRSDLRQEHFHCIVGEIDRAIAGQITVMPAARAGNPVDDPGLGHVRNLFVDRAHWGSGLAGRLHEAALGAARERGFAELRLFVADGQARAKAFYEREGWRAAGDPFDDPAPGLRMVEYRRLT